MQLQNALTLRLEDTFKNQDDEIRSCKSNKGGVTGYVQFRIHIYIVDNLCSNVRRISLWNIIILPLHLSKTPQPPLPSKQSPFSFIHYPNSVKEWKIQELAKQILLKRSIWLTIFSLMVTKLHLQLPKQLQGIHMYIDTRYLR